MPLHIVRDDLATMAADAIIVPANSLLAIGGGVGEAVARVAGIDALQAACDAIGFCPAGSAVATPAFEFPANVIVHAVGPLWEGGANGEAETLAATVVSALEVATDAGAETIALPLLSAGSFGYPSGEAIAIETQAIQRFLATHEADVWLVLYDRSAIRAGRALFDEIEEYIDDVYVGEHEYESSTIQFGHTPLPQATEEFDLADGASGAFTQPTAAFDAMPAATFGAPPPSLESKLSELDESFAATVLHLIDERGLTDVEVYKKANMSRQLFAKIRKDDDYRPTKKTACALAFALELDLKDTLELLSRAGFTLSHSSKFDVIIEYFLLNDIHDIFQVNEALFAYDQPLLG